MKFEKIDGFKKMTEEAMMKINGGGAADTLKQKTWNVTYQGTPTTCATGSYQNADPCTIQDIKNVGMD